MSVWLEPRRWYWNRAQDAVQMPELAGLYSMLKAGPCPGAHDDTLVAASRAVCAEPASVLTLHYFLACKLLRVASRQCRVAEICCGPGLESADEIHAASGCVNCCCSPPDLGLHLACPCRSAAAAALVYRAAAAVADPRACQPQAQTARSGWQSCPAALLCSAGSDAPALGSLSRVAATCLILLSVVCLL